MTLKQLSDWHPNERFFASGTAYHRFFQEAPYYPRCSDDKTASLVRPRNFAIKFPYIQANRSDFVSWLIFDLDHNNPYIWSDAGLPAPNLIVQNRTNGHAHLYYAITPVCTSANAHNKPIAYMRSVYESFAEKLNADPDYHSGPVAKTPGHPWWTTAEIHNKTFELGELADYCELPRFSFKPRANIEEVSHSRNCMLFEKLRHYAYSLIADYRSLGFERFLNTITSYAEQLNKFENLGFSSNLPLADIKATSKSVARWTFYKYTGNQRCHRGVMQLDPDLPTAEKQKLAAAYTAGRRADKTRQAILNAARGFISNKLKLTRTALAAQLKISRQTVASYWDDIQKLIAPQHPEANGQNQDVVKFGVYQVTALRSGEINSVNQLREPSTFSTSIAVNSTEDLVFKKKAFFKRE